ncbi:flavin oxidoreductase [Flavobacterium branchiophilum]|uniref:Flavin oxidoreductase n=1 Tax=Flavobacterium branchiophilum TaxID=55197 RepID=A0A2H3KJF1_9FLAO|nr:flavin oxidoreductase [Flavobacterium branchiophilum]
MIRQKYLSQKMLLDMEQQQKVQFINSVIGFKSVCLIGTQNKAQQTNVAIFSSLIHIGSNPPLFGIVFRPNTVERHTLENILNTGCYTINHIHEQMHQQAHQTAARYDRNTSEFDATGLTPEYKNDFFAPFVQESRVQLAMELRDKITLSINNTELIIGEIKEMYFPEAGLQKDGFLDIEQLGTITCSGLDSYHKTTQIARWSYAKPDKPISVI